MPALHISLGTYLKLFNMMEKDCLMLDIKLAGQKALKNNTMTAEEYEKHVEAYKKVIELKSSIEELEETINLVTEAVALNVMKQPENEDFIHATYQPRLDFLNKRLQKKVKNLIEN